MTPEGELKKKYRAYLKQIGAYDFAPVQTGYGKRTIDDLCCIKGRFVGMEAKAPGEEPTPLQYRCMEDIKKAGGVAFWFDSYEGFLLNMAAWGLARA